MTTQTASAPQTATPNPGQTASNPASAPVAQTPAPETQSGSGQQQQATASKPLGTLGAETAKPAGETNEATATYTLKPPDGFDGQVLDVYTKSANELKVPQEAAQKLLDQSVSAYEARQVQQVKDVQKSWMESMHKEFGEAGSEKLKSNLDTANAALTKFGTPALEQLLDESGLRVNPEIIRLFHAIGTRISEDKISVSNERSGAAPQRVPGQVGFNTKTAGILYDAPTKK